VVGITAALTQINVAEPIVIGLFYALLALIVGVGIVAIGGGGIQPMRERWNRALNRMEREAPQIREEVRTGGAEALRERGDEVRREVGTEPQGAVGAETPTAHAGPAEPSGPEQRPGMPLPPEERR
jgi:hypothetical protein